MQPRRLFSYLGVLALIAAFAAPIAAQAGPPRDRYIVVLNADAGFPDEIAADIALRTNGQVGYVYEHALQGFSITMPRVALAGVTRDPRVAYVEEDIPVSIFAQTTPTGVQRIFADLAFVIDESDERVDVDVAVIDSGIDLGHPDLNVVGGTNCMGFTTKGPIVRFYFCDDAAPIGDDFFHGTHVAGTIGALDNDIGVVGVAPGARLWAVKVLDSIGSGTLAGVIAGIDWVVERGDIEVINMSLGGDGSSRAMNTAVANAVASGVTVVVAAGNDDKDAAGHTPANAPDAITVSALADFDGLPYGAIDDTSSFCRNDQDDTLADFSNWGQIIDIAAPGVCIYSTYPGGYGTISGTSMASPHVAGAAALLASTGLGPVDIRNMLVTTGNTDDLLAGGWDDDSADGFKEPLLDISTFVPVLVATGGGGGGGNSAPTASFIHDDCVAGADCSFNGSGSTDPDGDDLTYAWDFQSDGTIDETGVLASFTYSGDGTYDVTLTVTDLDSLSGFDTQSVSVSSGDGGGGGGTSDACDELANGVHLTPSSTSQGKFWTAIVDAVNCASGDLADVAWVDLSWPDVVGTPDDNCLEMTTSECRATQSGIRKNTGSVGFELNGIPTTVFKP